MHGGNGVIFMLNVLRVLDFASAVVTLVGFIKYPILLIWSGSRFQPS